MEVLTAYVRQHARRMPEQKLEGAEETAVEEKSKEDSRGEFETTGVPTLDSDIQTIMTVLRRRSERTYYLAYDGEPEPLDLRGTHLLGAEDLRGADLSHAQLSHAQLRGADFLEANLSRADLSGANLLEATLRGANLSGATLRGAELSKANFLEANLSRADLSEVLLSGLTDFSRADLSGADLRGAVRSLWGLSAADIEGMGLKVEDVEGWGHMVAEVAERVGLKGPAQAGAELSLLEVLQAQLEDANGDANTKLPSGLKPPAHWGVKTDEQTEGE
jgi:uncharacterized protein YjbI with pentapeptide repeats